MKRIRKAIGNKSAFIFFYVSWLILYPLHVTSYFLKNKRQDKNFHSVLCIAAGQKGWESIELKELDLSSREYLGENSVRNLVIDKSKSHVYQLWKYFSDNEDITHYLFDPRTGIDEESLKFWNSLLESILIALILKRYSITPIVYLTDMSYRYWRCQSAAVSSLNGVVVTFMSPILSKPMFPHRRLIGPSIMPISKETLRYLLNLKAASIKKSLIENKVRFVGSMYEPRRTFLKNLETRLGERADIKGRTLGSSRQNDETYWNLLSTASIVVTTAEQFDQPNTDMTHVPQLVYRYLEVLAVNTLLLAPVIPGIERYFVPNVHFVSYTDLDDAHNKAVYYLENRKEARSIALDGHNKALNLIQSSIFWVQIDTALSHSGFKVAKI